MILLDENFPESQHQLLRSWHIPVRQIGYGTGRKGMADSEIIPLLVRLRRPTFFSLDYDFYMRSLCHARYSLVCLGVGQQEAATFVRRVLTHQELNSEAKRMGAVGYVSHVGISLWRLNSVQEIRLDWK